MKMNVLGTGFALATKNYNTCFALEENGSLFLVDGAAEIRFSDSWNSPSWTGEMFTTSSSPTSMWTILWASSG